jgi:hypothetical protein
MHDQALQQHSLLLVIRGSKKVKPPHHIFAAGNGLPKFNVRYAASASLPSRFNTIA